MRSIAGWHLPRRALFILAAVAFLICVYPTVRRGYAEWLYGTTGDPGRIEAGCRLEPEDSDCALIRAEVTESRRDELAAWEQAVRLNPRSADALSQTAIIREMNGDVAGAERMLLESERYNHLWLPRWSLANFYLRRQRPADTLKWARLALDRAYGDRRAAFRLCREAGASDQVILKDILAADQPQNLSAFLYWIAQEDRLGVLDQAVPRYLNAAARSGHAAEPASDPAAVLSDIIETLLQRGHPEEARDLWNRLIANHLLPGAGPDANTALTNPSFDLPVHNPPGFDWRTASIAGIEIEREAPGGMRFQFNGSQPEVVELLAQAVDLAGHQSWELDYEYLARDIPAGALGLEWVLTPWGGSETVAADHSQKSVRADGWTRESSAWTIPGGARFFRLALIIRRVPGHTRIQGAVQVRMLHLSAAPSSEEAKR